MTIDEQKEQLDKVLDEYESGLGLGYGSFEKTTSAAMEILGMEPDRFSKLSAEQCAEHSIVLQQFAIHLQRGINRETARVTWSNAKIDQIITKDAVTLIGYYGREERRAAGIRTNDVAQKLERVHVNAQLRIDRLAFLVQRVEGLSARLAGYAQTKRRRGDHD